jgi:AmmeMemoRadiSam system protein A
MQADAPDGQLLGATLLTLARGWIAHAFDAPSPEPPHDEALTKRLGEPGATFVTITYLDGSLHGCIGSLEPRRALADDIRANALAAAFLDPRSEPLTKRMLGAVVIEVSLLGPLERIAFTSEEEAIERIRPHEDGLVLSWGPIRGVLLPQVWERVPSVREFLSHLKRKAGLPPTFWAPGVELRRFGLEKWHEEVPRARSAVHASAHA